MSLTAREINVIREMAATARGIVAPLQSDVAALARHLEAFEKWANFVSDREGIPHPDTFKS